MSEHPKMKAWQWAVVTIICLILCWWVWYPEPRAARLQDWSPEEKRYVVQRMKYHGITSCIQDEKGYYFIRAGKRCRL